jgi:uracil-DNA glycosylase family 4
MAVSQHPVACRGCSLDERGTGFAPPEGPPSSPLLWLGEALGGTEAAMSRPFVGDAGGMLQRLLNLLGWKREAQRIGNCIQCRPPNDWMDGSPQAPWFYSSLDHCRVHRDPLLAEGHKVVIALGGTALKVAMGLLGQKKIRVQDFHGSVLRDPTDRFWVVPTFHPSFLQRGAHNLIGTVLWDLQQAEQAILHGAPASDHSLILDPPVDWFHAWVDTAIAMRQQDPWAYPVTSDIETPDKAGGQDEGEISAEDRSYQILRVNVSVHPDEGVTVPYLGPYIDELKRLHQSPGPIWGWNYIGYDFARTVAAGLLREVDFPKVIDLMWLWHKLQSDLPRGLGFVAPFYSAHGPWKHIAESEPAKYGAIDGLQNHRIGFGVMRDLHKEQQYDHAMRYVHDLMYMALRPAQLVGVQVDKPALLTFKAELGAKASRMLAKIQACVPDDLKPLTPKQGLTKKPLDNVLHVKATAFTRKGVKRAGKDASEIKLDLYKTAVVVERTLEREVLVCRRCGLGELQRRHKCRAPESDQPRDGASSGEGGADLVIESRPVIRWFWQEPFNPDSPDQVLAYIKFRKHAPGRAKKTGKDSTNKETLKKLVRTGDPFYPALLDYRAVMKVKGTYVDGIERRLDKDSRIHPEPTFVPSTDRLSYVNPNITNVVADKEGKDSLAAGFRHCVVATAGHRLLEVDFSGSEAVDFGWWMRDPGYIDLAKLGVHAGLASHVLGRPYQPQWSSEEKGAYFKAIKKSKDQAVAITYDRSKRFVHGYSYGLTIPGMVLQFPEIFPTKKVAEEYAAIFNHMAPKAGPFQRAIRELAFKQHYLGGPGVHPFGSKHWFWSVYTFKKITPGQYWKILRVCRQQGMDDSAAPVTIINGQYFKISLGEDGKRVVAFLPQSTTAGKLKEVMLRLFDPASPSYIGQIADGLTPLRAPIHDSLLLDIPARLFDLVAEAVFREMQRPFQQLPCPPEWGLGPYLSTGVSAKTGKVGQSWADLEDLDVPKFAELGVGSDRIATAPVEEDAEDADDFAREIA